MKGSVDGCRSVIARSDELAHVVAAERKHPIGKVSTPGATGGGCPASSRSARRLRICPEPATNLIQKHELALIAGEGNHEDDAGLVCGLNHRLRLIDHAIFSERTCLPARGGHRHPACRCGGVRYPPRPPRPECPVMRRLRAALSARPAFSRRYRRNRRARRVALPGCRCMRGADPPQPMTAMRTFSMILPALPGNRVGSLFLARPGSWSLVAQPSA